VLKINIQNLSKELRRKASRNFKKNDIVFMATFGSFIKVKQNRKSDINIAIEFDKNSQIFFDFVRIEEELKKIFKRKVDLGIFGLSPYIIEDVKREFIKDVTKEEQFH